MRALISRSGVLAASVVVVVTTGCELRKPFEGTVIAAGADASKVKNGFFLERTIDVGGVAGAEAFVSNDIETARPILSLTGTTETAVALEPLQIDDETVGQVVFDLLEDGPAEATSLVLLSWVDVDDDDLLDLSVTGESEVARTIQRLQKESNTKATLAFYNYNPNGGDPFYTATALDGPASNVIVTEDFVSDWMAVLPQDLELPPAVDSDADGLNDSVETAIGTSPFSADSDADAIDDLTEVGADPAAPLDTDADGTIDALDADSDNDGVDDFTEGVADDDGDGIAGYVDADEL
jgi:hypothetical protein